MKVEVGLRWFGDVLMTLPSYIKRPSDKPWPEKAKTNGEIKTPPSILRAALTETLLSCSFSLAADE